MQAWWTSQFGGIDPSFQRTARASHNVYSMYAALVPENPYQESENSEKDSFKDSQNNIQHREMPGGVLSSLVLSFLDDLHRQHTLDSQKPKRAPKCCAQCHQKLAGKVLTTADGANFHYSCFVCHDCGKPCGKKYFVKEIEVPAEAEVERENGTDNDRLDQISITAPLRINRSLTLSSRKSTNSRDSSAFSAHNRGSFVLDLVPASPECSTFDHALSASTSRTSIDTHEYGKDSHYPATALFENTQQATVKKQVTLCELHMFQRMDLVCNTCHTAIRDQLYMNFAGKKYHLNHLSCSICHKENSKKSPSSHSCPSTPRARLLDRFDFECNDYSDSSSRAASRVHLQQKFFQNRGHLYCQDHYRQYFVDLKCGRCCLDLSQELDFKMVQMPNDPRVSYYDKDCFAMLYGK